MRRITDLIGGRLRLMGAAVAGAIALAGCATVPADDAGTDAPPAGTAVVPGAPGTSPASPFPRSPNGMPASAAPASSGATSGKPPTRTVTLPPTGRVSLSEYRAQMRRQLMQSENASADVADCAAHASWVVPRSVTYDALKIPTGALGAGRASVENWEGRFSPGKQAVPVSSVVTFQATAHKRRANDDWEPVKVRCGYADGMMLAYELLDGSGTVIAEPAAAPAVQRPAAATKSKKKGTKANASSTRTKSSTAKSTAKPSASKPKASSARKKTN